MRSRPLLAAFFLLASGLLAAVTATSHAAANELSGSVTAGADIVLRGDNGPVSRIAPGTYTIHVRDTATEHNFHLKGPGVDRATGVDETESVTWTETLAEGKYTYLCDVHPGYMLRTFNVGNAQPTATLKVSAVSVRVRKTSLLVRLTVNRKAAASVALLLKSKRLVAQTAALHPGPNVVRLALPKHHPAGSYIVRITIRDASGTTRVVRRAVRLPRR